MQQKWKLIDEMPAYEIKWSRDHVKEMIIIIDHMFPTSFFFTNVIWFGEHCTFTVCLVFYSFFVCNTPQCLKTEVFLSNYTYTWAFSQSSEKICSFSRYKFNDDCIFSKQESKTTNVSWMTPYLLSLNEGQGETNFKLMQTYDYSKLLFVHGAYS